MTNAIETTINQLAAIDETRLAFHKFCHELNEQCKQKQTESKQIVSEATAAEALAYVKMMALETAGDILLYGAAMNVLNTYVKQPGNKHFFGYFFKNDASRLVDILAARKIEDVTGRVYIDNGMNVFQVSVAGIQFSFHCVPRTASLQKLFKETLAGDKQPFDGIRKQMCANSFFASAEGNRLLRSNKTKDGKDLIKEFKSLVNAYADGRLALSEMRNIVWPEIAV